MVHATLLGRTRAKRAREGQFTRAFESRQTDFWIMSSVAQWSQFPANWLIHCCTSPGSVADHRRSNPRHMAIHYSSACCVSVDQCQIPLCRSAPNGCQYLTTAGGSGCTLFPSPRVPNMSLTGNDWRHIMLVVTWSCVDVRSPRPTCVTHGPQFLEH